MTKLRGLFSHHHLLWVWAMKRLRFWAFLCFAVSVENRGWGVLFCLIDATGVQNAVAAASSTAIGMGCFLVGLVF